MASYPLVEIDAMLLESAFEEARSTEMQEFNTEQLGWLESHSGLAYIAIRTLNIGEKQVLAMLGFAVGTHVTRKHIESGQIDLQTVAGNHQTHYLDKRVVNSAAVETDRFTVLFGKNAGDTMAEIKNPVVRTFSTLMLITSLSGETTQETEDFIKPSSQPTEHRSRSSARMAGRA